MHVPQTVVGTVAVHGLPLFVHPLARFVNKVEEPKLQLDQVPGEASPHQERSAHTFKLVSAEQLKVIGETSPLLTSRYMYWYVGVVVKFVIIGHENVNPSSITSVVATSVAQVSPTQTATLPFLLPMRVADPAAAVHNVEVVPGFPPALAVLRT